MIASDPSTGLSLTKSDNYGYGPLLMHIKRIVAAVASCEAFDEVSQVWKVWGKAVTLP